MHPMHTTAAGWSIWQTVGQEKFRSIVRDLKIATNEVPREPYTYSKNDWLNRGNRDGEQILPFDVEQYFADSLAFLAASEEGVRTVAAVALEQHLSPSGLTVVLAANESIPKEVCDTLLHLFDILHRCASRTISRSLCAEQLFDAVVDLSSDRINARLESSQWKIPYFRPRKTSEPLTERLTLSQYSLRKTTPLGNLANQERFSNLHPYIQKMHEIYLSLESASVTEHRRYLKDLILQAHSLSLLADGMSFETNIRSIGILETIIGQKDARMVDKLSSYWHMCPFMADVSRKYHKILGSIKLCTLPPYSPQLWQQSILSKTKLFVHAEIQIVVHYTLHPVPVFPRVIGASKEACYLCDAFVRHHGQFFLSKTHGRLFDQWTVPSLSDFTQEHTRKFQAVLLAMLTEMNEERQRQIRGLPHPNQSSVRLFSGVISQTSKETIQSVLSVLSEMGLGSTSSDRIGQPKGSKGNHLFGGTEPQTQASSRIQSTSGSKELTLAPEPGMPLTQHNLEPSISKHRTPTPSLNSPNSSTKTVVHPHHSPVSVQASRVQVSESPLPVSNSARSSSDITGAASTPSPPAFSSPEPSPPITIRSPSSDNASASSSPSSVLRVRSPLHDGDDDDQLGTTYIAHLRPQMPIQIRASPFNLHLELDSPTDQHGVQKKYTYALIRVSYSKTNKIMRGDQDPKSEILMHVVDPYAMKPGSDVIFERAEDDDGLVLILRRRGDMNGAVRVDCRWMRM